MLLRSLLLLPPTIIESHPAHRTGRRDQGDLVSVASNSGGDLKARRAGSGVRSGGAGSSTSPMISRIGLSTCDGTTANFGTTTHRSKTLLSFSARLQMQIQCISTGATREPVIIATFLTRT